MHNLGVRIATLGYFVLGAVLAYPLTAFSKGQWCNDTEEGRRADLVLESASVDGAPVSLASPADLHLKTEFFREADLIHAEVVGADGGARVVHVERKP